MTQRRPDRALERIHSKVPGEDCAVDLETSAPEKRGALGSVVVTVGENGNRRRVWWLRCPWCREMIEVTPARIYVDAGAVRLDGPTRCDKCASTFSVADGRARLTERGVAKC